MSPAARSPKEPRPPSDRKPKAERWQELLDAAAAVFHEKGYDAASLQDIAMRVGILKGSIYHYIKTKADLRDSLLVEVHDQGFVGVVESAATEGTALDKLEAMIRSHVAYISANLPKATVYLQELKRLDPAVRAALLGERNYNDVFVKVITDGQQEGTILPDLDPQLSALAMISSLNSMFRWYSPQTDSSEKDLADHFVSTLLRGHAPPEAFSAHTASAASLIADAKPTARKRKVAAAPSNRIS